MWSWLVWLSRLSAGLRIRGSLVQVPVRAHAWVAGQAPGWRCVTGDHRLMFLSLSFPSPLYKNNKFLKRKKKEKSKYEQKLPQVRNLFVSQHPWFGLSFLVFSPRLKDKTPVRLKSKASDSLPDGVSVVVGKRAPLVVIVNFSCCGATLCLMLHISI